MYCDYNFIKSIYPEKTIIALTDDQEIGESDDFTSRINNIIASADTRINAKIGKSYPVPLSVVPDIIQKCSADIFWVNIHTRRLPEIPKSVSDIDKAVEKTLTAIADGDQPLYVTSSLSSDVATGALVTAHFRR